MSWTKRKGTTGKVEPSKKFLENEKITFQIKFPVSYWIMICRVKLVINLDKMPLSYVYKQPPEVFCKKRCSQKFLQKSQENTCARVSFLMRLQASACNFIKNDWHRCFPVNFAKFLVIPFLQNISGRLLLYVSPRKHTFSPKESTISPSKVQMIKGKYGNFCGYCYRFLSSLLYIMSRYIKKKFAQVYIFI